MKNESVKNEHLPVVVKVNNNVNALHSHTELEIVCVLKGTIHATVNGVKYELKEEDICIINSENIHVFEADEDSVYISLIIVTDFFNHYIPNISMVYYDCIPNPKLGGQHDNYLRELKGMYVDIVRTYFIQKDNASELIIEKTIDLFTQLRNWFTLIKFNSGGSKTDDQFDRIWDIIDYIYDRCWRRLPLSEIAELIHLSPSYLSHSIKEITGFSYEEMVNLIRSENALKLLIETDLTLTQISTECGFSDPKYFTMYFEKFYGIKPREYKSRNMGIRHEVEKYSKGNEDLSIWENYILNRLDEFESFKSYSKGEYEGRIQRRYNIDASELKGEQYLKSTKTLYIADLEDLLSYEGQRLIKDANEIAGFKVLHLDIPDKNLISKLKSTINKIVREAGMGLQSETVKDEDLHFYLYDQNGDGLFSKGGIRKKAFYVHYLFNVPHGRILAKEDGCLVCKSENCLYIIIYNNPIVEGQSISGSAEDIKLHISNLPPGDYSVVEYSIESNSLAFDNREQFELIENELPDNEIFGFETCYTPAVRGRHISIKGKYRMMYTMDPGSMVLVCIRTQK